MKSKLTIISIILLASLASGETMIQRISFKDLVPVFENVGDYQNIKCAGLTNYGKPGSPWLPVKTLNLLLLPEATVINVKASGALKDLPGIYDIVPAQRYNPISLDSQTPFVKDEAVYASSEDYPSRPIINWSQGNCGGYRLLSLIISPFVYKPREGSLKIFADMELTVEYRLDKTKPAGAVKLSPWVSENTANYGSFISLYPQRLSPKSDEYDLLIITATPFDTVFQRFSQWKNARGLRTRLAVVDSIYSNYPGRDQQEKLRNFVIEQYQSKGIGYLLLAGDYGLVPARTAFAVHSGYEEPSYVGIDSLICDLYFSDLDGSWDLNGNGIFGETEDSVDMYPEIAVGRATVNSIFQAQTFVDKILTYEKAPPAGYLNRGSFWASTLDVNTDAAKGKEIIAWDYLIDFFRPVEKLYQSSGNENPATIIQALNDGRHLINHNGHSGFFKMQGGNGWLDTMLMDTLHNPGEWGILYSQGCQAAGFDSNSIAEHFVNNPQGGGLAFIGNSRYGWYTPYFPGYGPSDLYDNAFFDQLLIKRARDLGWALGFSKADLIPLSRVDGIFRWVNYNLNLLGDPTLSVWTAAPESLEIICMDSISTGAFGLQVCVNKNGEPAAGAVVTFYIDSSYVRAVTGPDGQVLLSGFTSAGQDAQLSVWSTNCLPAEKTVRVVAPCPSLLYAGHRWSETIGNGDGLPGPGESGTLEILVKNTGSLSSGTNAGLILRSIDGNSTVSDSLSDISGILPGDSLWTTGVPTVSFDSSCHDQDIARFLVEMSDSAGHVWQYRMGQAISAPALQYIRYLTNDSAWGNGNGIIESGETTAVRIFLKNCGSSSLSAAALNLSSQDSLITMVQAGDSLKDLAPDSVSSTVFILAADPAIPGPNYFAAMHLTGMFGGLAWDDTFLVAIGQTGFSDSIENGPGNWTVTDSSFWHISDLKSHSNGHSWYFGSDSNGLAPFRATDTLETLPLIMGPSNFLSFWQWYDLVPGWAYGYIEIEDSTGVRVLDVITGSSLQWENKLYSLTDYSAGQMIKVRFIANADSEGSLSQGWFIDDINIGPEITGVKGRPAFTVLTDRLLPNNPNPFSGSTKITFQISRKSPVELSVYNIVGQRVKILASDTRQPGSYDIYWDGRDFKGNRMPAGIYLVRLVTPERADIGRMVMVK